MTEGNENQAQPEMIMSEVNTGEESPVEATEQSQEARADVAKPEDKLTASLPDDEAAKIRHATEHKVSKKYEQQLNELRSQLEKVSTPPDDESVYDEILQEWRPRNMDVSEYQAKIKEAQQRHAEQEQQRKALEPIEKRAAAASSKIEDFQSVMSTAVQTGRVSQHLVLEAGRDDGGLETLYELTKTNSPKLFEIQSLPTVADQRLALARIVWERSKALTPKTESRADTPLNSVEEVGDTRVDYNNLNFSDGYKEFLKQRDRGRG